MTAAVIRPLGVSSDYAAQVEMITDLQTAVNAILHADFPRGKFQSRLWEPPMTPQLGCVWLYRDELRAMPILEEAALTDILAGIAKAAARTYPSMPIAIEWLRPPLAARFGFVIHLVQTAEKPIYPRIVRAGKVVMRPSDTLRRLLGLPPKE